MCDRPLVNAHGYRPTVVDLYAGSGGLGLGMEQAGFDVLAAVEVDPVHAMVHRYNFPSCPMLCEDISSLTGERLLRSAGVGWSVLHPDTPFPGRVDAIVGGPPCQGFSVGGIRDAGDERNQQLQQFVRLVIELKPTVFCMENVSGLLESSFDTLREQAFTQLTTAGYALTGTSEWVDAQEFGVPQTRKRVILLGSLDGAPPPVMSGAASTVHVADALRGLPDLARYRTLLADDQCLWNAGERPTVAAAAGRYAATLAGLRRDDQDHSHPREWSPDLITGSRRTVHTARTVGRFSRTAPGAVERRSRLFRLDPDAVAHTLRAGTGADRGSHTSPRPIHPFKNRVITVREAARLHGYPDWFRFHTTNWHGHRQVGNSVPPPLGRAAGQALLRALGRTPVTPTEPVPMGDPGWLRLTRTTAQAALQGGHPVSPVLRPDTAA